MAKATKFGVFSGVFTPSILTILGVIMYLRLPWITGQAGLFTTLSIIIVAHIISGSTGLSVSSIATDKKIGTGGAYYIISRSLGLSIGGTLGLALFLGLSFSVSLYITGFTEILLDTLNIEADLTSKRITGSIVLVVVTIVTFISTSLNLKAQFIIMAAMVLSLLSIFFGRHEFSPATTQFSSMPGSLSWIALFAIFFPAVTGFEAGVSMSGDLKDPKKAIPLGTLTAIFTGLIVYIILAVFFTFTVNRQLLVYDPVVLTKISLVPSLVIAGILGATLSSALGSINAAPRIMQAVAKDRIMPYFLSKGYGPSNEPRNALLVTFLIAEAGILIGDLNVIARIVTIFFVLIYGFINITYTVESWASSDFMPTFKIPRLVSILGAVTCVVVMIQLDILAFIFSSLILGSLFLYLRKKELTLQTGDTRSSFWLSIVRTGLLKLTKSNIISRNWIPNLMLFSGGLGARPYLIELGKTLVGKFGILTNFVLIESKDDSLLIDKKARVSVETFGHNTNIITRRHSFRNIYDGIGMISRVFGFSGFEPNTILMGLPKNAPDTEKSADLFVTLHKLDYNLTFLSYDKISGFGKYRTIDFWWSGKGKNLAFALHLIRFITASQKWRDADIRIMAINREGIDIERYYSIMGQVIENYRIRANVKVINNIEKISEEDIIRSESFNTDLTLIEIPDLAKNEIAGTIDHAVRLSGNLKTCLFIHAYSAFEEINVITDVSPDRKKMIEPTPGNRPDILILDDLQLSQTDIIFNEVSNITKLLKKQSDELFTDTFFSILKDRDDFTDQFVKLTERTSEKLRVAGGKLLPMEMQMEYLRILNDYSEQAQKYILDLRDKHLRYENSLLRKGILRFIHKTEDAVNTLPKNIRRIFGKEDYSHHRPGNLTQKIKRTVIMLWLSVSGKKTAINIQLQPAARFYIYNKRLEFFRNFYEIYTEQTIKAFAGIRELLILNEGLIEKIFSGKIKYEGFLYEKKNIEIRITELRSQNKDFFYNQGHIMLRDIGQDLVNFSRIIEGPRANYLSRKFTSINKKTLLLREELSEFPDLWLRFMSHHVNKTYMDIIFMSLKNRLSAIIEKAIQDIEVRLGDNIFKSLDEFENQINLLSEKGYFPGTKYKIVSQKMIVQPKPDDVFEQMLKEINDAVEELPETIEITGDAIPENIQSGKLESMNEFVVSVRKTADFYISNELGDQIKKQSLNIGLQLSFSVSTIRDLIKLAYFNLDNLGNYYNDQQISDQVKILTENLLDNIKNEKNNLRKIISDVKNQLNNGLKNAFEPLSSAIIIKTSKSLREKIRDTDKRKLSTRLKKLKKSAGERVTNQYVKLLYSKSDGLLWANRLEQSREKALLYQGDDFNRFVKKISPDRIVIQNLPFYYSNLFSGSSSIGEDFWIGMDKEIKEGSRAIKNFSDGTPGMLVITGERSSGKSSLSKYLANLHFSKQNIFAIRAPGECTANAELFEQTLLKSLNGTVNLRESLEELPAGSVIIINDLELWWERKPSGTQVVEKIISLVQQFGNRILFIVNVNQHSLKIINQMTSINSWALGLVFCQPFDARELKDLIMIRHRAAGLKFILNKKTEDEMTKRDYARLFNGIFNLSSGNPGYAMNLWLAGIRKISENVLYMDSPVKEAIALPETLGQEEIIVILQFILHRRFSVKNLSEILKEDFESTGKIIRLLLQKRILTEKFPEIYSLNPALEILLAKKLKNLELI